MSVDTRGCSRTQNDKKLEKATKKYVSLNRDVGQSITHRSEVIAVYSYDPITDYDKDDALQRFGRLKVEATSFTISDPVTNMEVAPMIYELATTEQKEILEDAYAVSPFQVKTITLERIFVDKLFAAEAYVRKAEVKARAFEAAKHIYDLAVLEKIPEITTLIHNEKPLDKLLNIRLKEELERLDGVPGLAPKDFIFFEEIKNNNLIINAYETMQKQYVLRECDRIPYEDAVKALVNVQHILQKNVAWNIATVPQKTLQNEGDNVNYKEMPLQERVRRLPPPTEDISQEFDAYKIRMGCDEAKMKNLRYKISTYDKFIEELEARKKYYGTEGYSRENIREDDIENSL